MFFFYIKALHIIFVVTWFAGLFYIVRLFIYHVEAEEKPEMEKKILQKQFKIMSRRLWLIIAWPSAILTLIFGVILSSYYFPFKEHPWLLMKFAFILFLYFYHIICHYIYHLLQKNIISFSSKQLRIWNEVATIFLLAIVFIVVVVKNY